MLVVGLHEAFAGEQYNMIWCYNAIASLLQATPLSDPVWGKVCLLSGFMHQFIFGGAALYFHLSTVSSMLVV